MVDAEIKPAKDTGVDVNGSLESSFPTAECCRGINAGVGAGMG
jgi:hypothetical protein